MSFVKMCKKALSYTLSVGMSLFVIGGLLWYEHITWHPAATSLSIPSLILEAEEQIPIEEVVESVEPTEAEMAEVEWLTKGIYFEARNQPMLGQFRVAEAIANRVRRSEWPNTYEGVIRQGEKRRNRCQFSFM